MTQEKFFERASIKNAALLLIDHQNGLLSTVKTIEPEILKNNILCFSKNGKKL